MHQPPFADLCREHEIYSRYLKYKPISSQHHLFSGDPIDAFGIVTDGILKAETDTAGGEEMCSAYFEERIYYLNFYTSLAGDPTPIIWWRPKNYSSLDACLQVC